MDMTTPSWKERRAMDRRRTRTSCAAGLALALAGCVGTAPPSAAPPTSLAPTVAPSLAFPSPIASPTPITGLPFLGTIAYNRNLVDGNLDTYRIFTMPASGGEGTQLLDTEGEQARWSADGTRLSVLGEGPQGLIFVGFVDRDGTDYIRLDSPDPTLNLGCGAWSPDAAMFVCEAWDDHTPGRAGLYTVAADGTGLTRVTTAPAGRQDAPCDFSPDGTRIAFVRLNAANDNGNELMVVDRDGTGEHKLIDELVKGGCRWSQVTSMLVTVGQGGILVLNMADPRPTATLLPLDVPAGASFSHPGWSPDGTHLVMSVRTEGQPWNIWIADADGSGATQVTDTPGVDEEVESWGP
jgi:hypothetical protein